MIMNNRTLGIVCAHAALVVLAVPGFAQDLRRTVIQNQLAEATIVFVGEVVKVGSVSFPEVPAGAPTVVMRADNVIENGNITALTNGKRVTVRVRSLGLLQAGSHATVFAANWILGDGIAVAEVGSEVHSDKPSAARMQALGDEIRGARQAMRRTLLLARADAADVIVVGRVSQVRAPVFTSSAIPVRPGRITEHDPAWREAVVVVEQNLKGAGDLREVVVRFPASRDKMWAAATKFEVGQEWTFMLKPDVQRGGRNMSMMGAQEVQAYTALDRRDVLQKADADLIREILEDR